MPIIRVPEALEALKKGKMLIVIDDEDRENEGDFVFPAQGCTPEKVNYITKYGRGLVCVALSSQRARELNLNPLTPENTSPYHTNFTEPVDARGITTTGISAFDRSNTINRLIDPSAQPDDFVKPGHIFPLIARDGGVLKRAGHTEAVVDLTRLAGLFPAGVLCEILDEDGTMARLPQLEKISEKTGIPILTIRDLIEYRRKREKLIHKHLKVKFPTKFGEFDLYLFEDVTTNENHLTLVKGEPFGKDPVLVRVHSQCFTGDVLHSLRCDCGNQLEEAMRRIQKEGSGILIYMAQEGRGIGLVNKLKAYHLQDNGMDTVEANLKLGFKPDLRDYGIGAQILQEFNIRKIKLMTNNPRKIVAFSGYGMEVVERIPLEVPSHPQNRRYLQTKKEKMGHLLKNIEKNKK